MKLHLTSEWFIKPGGEKEVLPAVARLAREVKAGEKGTLTYLVHVPWADAKLQSLPPAEPRRLLFFEIYRNPKAFQDHVDGPLFKQFVQDYGQYFVSANGKPYTTVQFLSQHAGFVRSSP